MFTPLPDDSLESLFIELFKAIPELTNEVMPMGFANSELIQVFHPTAEQRYKEYCEMEIRFETLFKKKEKREPLKTFEEFVLTIEDTNVDELYEIVSIYGDCLWDIFSNNHTVYNENLESYDIGSFRGSGGFLADVIDKINLVPDRSFDYLDFYMGSFIAETRANLMPVYEFIFRKLKAKKIDWEYSFPRMGLINFNNDNNDKTEMKDYNPTTSVQKELEREKKNNEMKKFQQQLDDAYNEEYEQARYSKPAKVVAAYYSVYGHWPNGHPLAE